MNNNNEQTIAKAFNEVVEAIKNSYYMGYSVSIEQDCWLQLNITGLTIFNSRFINTINEIAKSNNLSWYMCVNLENKPQIKMYIDEYIDDEPF